MWTIRQTGVDRTSSALHKALGIGRLAKYAAGLSSKGGRRADFLPMDPGARRHKLETALMASAAILGFWGFQEVAPSQGRWSISGVWDSAYKTLQLLTTQFPGDIAKQLELPIPLQIARFAMPIFAVWFSFAALLRRYNRPLVAFVARLSRNHVVLIGDSPITAALARAYRLTGRRVVAISPPPVNSEVAVMEAAGARTIFGDPKTPSTLIKAAVQHAAIVIVAEDLGSESITLATRIAGLARKTRARTSDPLVLLMRITHRELRPLLSSQIATALIDSRVSLRLYVRERTIARSLLSRYPADWGSVPGLHDMHAVIFGLGDMGGEILLQLAKIAVRHLAGGASSQSSIAKPMD